MQTSSPHDISALILPIEWWGRGLTHVLIPTLGPKVGHLARAFPGVPDDYVFQIGPADFENCFASSFHLDGARDVGVYTIHFRADGEFSHLLNGFGFCHFAFIASAFETFDGEIVYVLPSLAPIQPPTTRLISSPGEYWNAKICVEQNVEVKRLRSLVSDEHFCLETALTQAHGVNQAKVVGPLLALFDGKVLWTEAKVDLD